MHIGYNESIDLDSIAEEIIERRNFCKQCCVNNITILSIFTKTNLNLRKLIRKRNERFITFQMITSIGTTWSKMGFI